MRTARPIAYAILACAALAMCSCDEPIPTGPPSIHQEFHFENIGNNTVPGTTPSPGASPAPGSGLTPTEAKVTIIGGDGTRVIPAGANFTVTFTRFAKNAQGVSVEVPGNPSDAVTWVVFGVEDRGSPTLQEGGATFVQNYNRDLRAGAAGSSFSVTARQAALEATLVGSVR